ncbi:helix-turn-helix transcriptional regulator [Streptomyces sp. NPDC015680]|uniref:helix-turn-helix transcriptional regulator n=1 Tax=Streptomyces sp. NPDC015680 TaxID=3364962 RepID=UPI0036F54BBC
MTNTQPAAEHVGVTEIGEMLAVSRQRANKLVARPDFPAPVAQTKAGRVWERAAVVAWEKGWDRDNVGGRPPKSAAAQQQE